MKDSQEEKGKEGKEERWEGMGRSYYALLVKRVE